MKRSTKISKLIGCIISLIILYLIFLLLYYLKKNSLAFPNPNYIIKEAFIILTKGSTYIALLFSLLRLILCIIISFIFSFIFASISYKYSFFKDIINPFVVLFRSTPVICLSLLFIIMFGTNLSVYVITNLVLFPLFYESIYQAFMNIDSNIIDAYKLDSKFNIRVLFKIYLPLSLNSIRTSLIEGLGLGFKVLLTAEYLSGKTNSLGYSLFLAYQNNIDMTEIYSYALILIFLSILINSLCNLIKNKI